MRSLNELSNDTEILDEFASKIRDSRGLVIDIRGNGGGSSSYWMEFFLPKILDKPYKMSFYSFIKDGYLYKDVIGREGYMRLTDENMKKIDADQVILDLISDFNYAKKFDLEVKPSDDSINYKGKIYLLIDNNVYSSSEMMASFCKETGLAKLVGQRSGGDGLGSDPIQVDLPRTGFVLRFSKEMGITESGSVNELEQTMPDILSDINFYDVSIDKNPILIKVIDDIND